MENKRRTTPPMRPLLSASEFMQTTGVSRQTLRSYEKEDICPPIATSSDKWYKYYSLDQEQIIELVEAMRRNGMGLPEIATQTEQGSNKLIDTALQQCIDSARTSRRYLKKVLHARRSYNDFNRVAGTQGTYLRYFPCRWMALFPVNHRDLSDNSAQPAGLPDDSALAADLSDDSAQVAGLPDDSGLSAGLPDDSALAADLSDDSALKAVLPSEQEYFSAHKQLKDVVEAVGWSETLSTGLLISTNRHMTSFSCYAFVELASPPMPMFLGSRLVDGGCYYFVTPDNDKLFGNTDNAGETATRAADAENTEYAVCSTCAACSRFGTYPTLEQKTAWRKAAIDNPNQWDKTLMSSALDAPYANGTWKLYTEHLFDGTREDTCEHPDMPLPPPEAVWADRPRLMPHELRLPLGVTACEIPPGIFVCEQHQAEVKAKTLKQFMQRVNRIPCEVLPDERDCAYNDSNSANPCGEPPAQQESAESAPFIEPPTIAQYDGDPSMAGWFSDASEDIGDKVHLAINAALAPEDGFCVIMENELLRPIDEPIAMELQTFVLSANSNTPPHVGQSDGSGSCGSGSYGSDSCGLRGSRADGSCDSRNFRADGSQSESSDSCGSASSTDGSVSPVQPPCSSQQPYFSRRKTQSYTADAHGDVAASSAPDPASGSASGSTPESASGSASDSAPDSTSDTRG